VSVEQKSIEDHLGINFFSDYLPVDVSPVLYWALH